MQNEAKLGWDGTSGERPIGEPIVRNEANSRQDRSEDKCFLKKELWRIRFADGLGKRTQLPAGWEGTRPAKPPTPRVGAIVRNEPNSRIAGWDCQRCGRNWVRLCGGVASGGGKRLRWWADGTCAASFDKENR